MFYTCKPLDLNVMEERSFKKYIILWLSQGILKLGNSMTGFALVLWAYGQSNSTIFVSLMSVFWWLAAAAAVNLPILFIMENQNAILYRRVSDAVFNREIKIL